MTEGLTQSDTDKLAKPKAATTLPILAVSNRWSVCIQVESPEWASQFQPRKWGVERIQ